MDFGYHHSVGRTMMMQLGIHEHLKMAHAKAIESLNKCITDLDSRADKQKFMELNNIYFMLPKKFEFQSFKGDEVHGFVVARILLNSNLSTKMTCGFMYLESRLLLQINSQYMTTMVYFFQ